MASRNFSTACYTTGQVVLVSKFAWTIGKQTQNRRGLDEYTEDNLPVPGYPFDRRDPATAGQFVDAVNKALESETRITLSGNHLGKTGISDGVYDARWVCDTWEGWVQYTFQKDGVLQPYRIREYAFTLGYHPWVWYSHPHSWDVYGSNVADPEPYSLANGAANADWTLIETVPGVSYGATVDDQYRTNSLSYYWTLDNDTAYRHYVFRIRNLGEVFDPYIRVGELQLFDYMEEAEPGNNPPSIALSPSTSNGEAPLTVAFDASATTDGEGDALYYAWDFGNGPSIRKTEDLHTVEHTYYEPGTYSVTLTVTDGHGSSATETIDITVGEATLNQPPDARMNISATTVQAGTVVDFDASPTTEPDGESMHFEWEFGNGQKATGEQVSHFFGAGGEYSVVLYVYDERGGIGIAKGDITVEEPNAGRPVISFNFGVYPHELNPSQGAGAVPVKYWNNFYRMNADGLDRIVDSRGQLSDISIAREGGGLRGSLDVNEFDGNAVMMSQGMAHYNPWSLTVSNIPYTLYDVYLYYGGDEIGEVKEFTIGSQTYYALDSEQGFDGEFNRSVATSPSEVVDGHELILFETLGLDEFTIDFPNSSAMEITGTQIVDLGNGPIVRNDEAETLVDTPVVVDVLANDIGQGIEIASIGAVAEGTAEIVDGTIRYTPAAGFTGETEFTYTIVDDFGTSIFGSVSITVLPVQTVSFLATDDTAAPEPGVAITVGDRTVTTDTAGEATLQLPDGDFSYSADKTDHFATSGSFSVSGGPVTVAFTIERIYPPVLTSFVVEPDMETVLPGESVQFTAIGYDQYGLEIALDDVQWSYSGPGTIDSSGLLQAGLTYGTGTLEVEVTFDGTTLTQSRNFSVRPEFDIISVNFGRSNRGPEATEEAGAPLYRAAHWSFFSTGSGNSLVDHEGNPTTASFSVTGDGGVGTGRNQAPDDEDPDNRIMFGSINEKAENGSATLSLSAPAAFTDGDGWDLVIYWYMNEPSVAKYTLTHTGESYFMRGAGASKDRWDGTHRRSLATTETEAQLGHNYIVFEGITQSTVEVLAEQVSGVDNARMGMMAFQMVKPASSSAPEPDVLPEVRIRSHNGGLRFRFSTEEGTTYQLRSSTSLDTNPSTWEAVGSPVTGDGSVMEMEVTDPALSAGEARFYSLEVTP